MKHSDLVVGFEIPSVSRKTGFQNWNRFAAVNDEFVDIHMDDDAGKAAGYAGAFGMGRLQNSYLHLMLDDWLEHENRIVKISAQFRAPNLKGMVLTAKGRITAVTDEADETMVDLDVWIEDAEGKVMAPGTATVAVAEAGT